MEYTTKRLKELKAELYTLSKEARHGKLNRAEAADRIIELHQQIEEILEYLSKDELKGLKV